MKISSKYFTKMNRWFSVDLERPNTLQQLFQDLSGFVNMPLFPFDFWYWGPLKYSYGDRGSYTCSSLGSHFLKKALKICFS
jgi:hypothetical protein